MEAITHKPRPFYIGQRIDSASGFTYVIVMIKWNSEVDTNPEADPIKYLLAVCLNTFKKKEIKYSDAIRQLNANKIRLGFFEEETHK